MVQKKKGENQWMGNKKNKPYQNGFDLDYWMTRLVDASSPDFYPPKLKCMSEDKKKKHKKSDN